MYQHKKYTIDFTNVKHYLEIYEIIRLSLDFPDYCGSNWDAIWDCLTDMYGDRIHIEITGLDMIKKRFGNDTVDELIEILRRFKRFSDEFADDILIEIVDKEHQTLIE